MAMPEKIKKRDGRVVRFDQSKITEAIYKAAESVDGNDRELAEALTEKVTEVLGDLFTDKVPTIEDIQDTVEKVLIDSGHSRTAKSFILYRKKRDEIRAKTKVRKVVKKKASTTDKHLLVDSDASMEYQEWNKARIADSLVNEKGIQPDEAAKIASVVEKRVIQSGVSRISLALIRELVNNELFERGYTELLERQTLIGMTVSEMDDLIHSKSKENANIAANNPEAINLAMSEFMQKQYALNKVFSPDVAEFHRDGRVHLHDLGMPVRVYSYHQDETMIVKHHDRLYNISFKRLWELSDATVIDTGDMEIKLLPDTFVTDSGGIWTRVKQIMRHKNTKKLLSVENDAGKSVIVTEDHPFIVNKERARYHECPVCREKTSRTNGSTKPGSKTYMCKCGKQFMKRDVPYDVKSTMDIPANDVGTDHMSIVDLSFPKNDFNSSEIIPINEDLAYIIGLFVSEGSTEEQSVYIAGKNHKAAVIDFCSRNSLSFGDRGDGVSIYSKAFKNTLDMWGVTGYSHEKALPDFYLSLPHDTLWKMLIGVIDGDGTSRDCEISVRVTSRCLVSQIMQLCRRLGVRSRISAIERYESETSFKGTKQMYSLAIYPSESDLVKLADSRRERFQIIPSSKKTMRNKSDREIFCSRIKRVREVDYYSEYVYDITTESSTFLCNELLVHNCSGHSLEYIKMYGLDLWTMDTKSAPAKHANTLTGHLNTFLSNMQAYYAGALGLGAVNVFYAPYLEDSTDDEILQVAQYMIFSGAQNCFSRGGQTLFLDFNINAGVPGYLKDVPAVGAGGKYTGRTYGSYEKTAQRMAKAMLKVWKDGDSNGHILQFPKPNFHINEETFSEPGQREVFDYACEVSAHNGTPYFAFDRDSASQSACCRLRFTIEDEELLKHPERQRFCGFQNVTVNLPQCAYRAGKGKIRKLYAEIDKAMDICLKAHLQKKAYIAGLMAAPNLPLWQLGKIVSDGKPYVELDKCTYIIGMIGLNECVQFLLGKELHEDDETLKAGLRIISHMFYTVKEFGEKYGLKFTLEESPAESASRRFARIDLKKFPESVDVVKGDVEKDECYYTNSIHLRADCKVDLVQRIVKQAKFHNLIESGAIIHAFVGENRPSAKAIAKLVEMTYRKTNAAQITISPEFTICNRCKKMIPGMSTRCQSCGAENITEAKRKAISPDGTWTKENIEKFMGGKE